MTVYIPKHLAHITRVYTGESTQVLVYRGWITKPW